MKQYHDLCSHILENGTVKKDRTGTGTISVFGYQMRFNLQEGFPLVTTKKVFTKGIIHELIWFLKGDTNINYLVKNGVNIWTPDAYREHKSKCKELSVEPLTEDEFKLFIADSGYDLGPIYGKQWRSWDIGDKWPHAVDQITDVINQIKTNPDSRRLIVTAWNPADIPDMTLPPCHCFFQFYVENGKLSCQLYQRSGDVFLGVPFNIASYAMLVHIVAQLTDLEVGEFIHTFGDAHIYLNHIDQVKKQLSRKPKELPKFYLTPSVKSINELEYKHFHIVNYDPHPPIKGKVSVG